MSSVPPGRAPTLAVVCAPCGARAGAGDYYCTACGTRLPSPDPRRPSQHRAIAVAVGGVLLVGVVLAAVVTGARLQGAGAPNVSASQVASLSTVSVDGEAVLGTPFGVSHDEKSCPSALLNCTLLTVPADHSAPDGATIEVRFGRHAADEDRERLGTLVVVTGGPGSSGIDEAQFYLDMLPAGVVDRYDLVFLEQRGVGKSIPLTCREAELTQPDWIAAATSDLDAALDATRAWVDDCLREADVDDAAMMGRYATYQSAADLDAYLDRIGAGQVVLFGESYGTVLAQLYAAERPERVRALILDAPVDAALGGVEQVVGQARAFSEVLDRVFDECVADELCAADFVGGDPGAAWDELAVRLADGSAEVELPTRGGKSVTELGLGELLMTTTSLLYTEWDRVHLLRALAAASRDDLRPFVRLAALTRGVDPETDRPFTFAEPFTAAYFGIGCQDFDASADNLNLVVNGVAELVESGVRLAPLVYDVLPCLAGFTGPGPMAAPDVSLPDVPILILSTTADPATPTSWAEALAHRAPNAHLVLTEGGGHGSFGWGFPCTDDAIGDLLAFGDLPAGEKTSCEGYLMDPYVPLPLAGPDDYPDLIEALLALDQAVWMLPDYVFWDGGVRRLGCPHGGWMQMGYAGVNESFELNECRIFAEWPVTGTISYDQDYQTTMELDVPGGQLEYRTDDNWQISVTGTIDGEEINLSR